MATKSRGFLIVSAYEGSTPRSPLTKEVRPHWFPRCLRTESQSYVAADPGDIPPTSISGVGLFWFTPSSRTAAIRASQIGNRNGNSGVENPLKFRFDAKIAVALRVLEEGRRNNMGVPPQNRSAVAVNCRC